MKKLIVFITISLIIAASFTVLSANATPEKSDENIQIGISKLISHPALDAIEEGIKDYLNENGIVAAYETQTANGEISTASSIAQLFKTKGKDLVVGRVGLAHKGTGVTVLNIPFGRFKSALCHDLVFNDVLNFLN